MLLKTKNLKFTHLNKIAIAIILLTQSIVFAQEVIQVDSTGVAKETELILDKKPTNLKDTIVPFKRFKAEGVAAVVGEYVILDSDIDKSYLEFEQTGVSTADISRCQLLGKLMEDKLYIHQARVDSILVSDTEINPQVDQLVEYMVGQLGSEEKVVEYYRKDNITELKNDLLKAKKDIELANRMQAKVVENAEVTPEEVRQFFYNIPEDERPVFSAEVEIAQIVIEPEVTKEAKQAVIDRLNEFRADIVENGASFATKAVLYSKDGAAATGGLLPSFRRGDPYAKEFKDVAFSLLEGEVSEPFETDFGFHILKVDKIKGQEVDVRHIILFPELSQATIDKAKEKVDKIRENIINDSISFGDAARLYSDQKETRNNGGQLVNPSNQDTRFDLTKMDPTLGAQVYNLQEGEVSKVFVDQDRTGKKTFKFLTVTNRYDEHPADFIKDYEKIKELALRQKQINTIEKWQNKKIKDTYISVDKDYKDCEFASNWTKKLK
ncbi:peptidylprolyl isomerase [Patiriisocius marinistellae]|uniref:Peptidylprolyl isomerase n=1 Tax=Patiriisocius marinistellae TaxID=2494560 RepID=A0A5J4FZQ0_9FLAO|nr:peptidylprolyl isomerase [Patiriisocius marinistellae]